MQAFPVALSLMQSQHSLHCGSYSHRDSTSKTTSMFYFAVFLTVRQVDDHNVLLRTPTADGKTSFGAMHILYPHMPL